MLIFLRTTLFHSHDIQTTSISKPPDPQPSSNHLSYTTASPMTIPQIRHPSSSTPSLPPPSKPKSPASPTPSPGPPACAPDLGHSTLNPRSESLGAEIDGLSDDSRPLSSRNSPPALSRLRLVLVGRRSGGGLVKVSSPPTQMQAQKLTGPTLLQTRPARISLRTSRHARLPPANSTSTLSLRGVLAALGEQEASGALVSFPRHQRSRITIVFLAAPTITTTVERMWQAR